MNLRRLSIIIFLGTLGVWHAGSRRSAEASWQVNRVNQGDGHGDWVQFPAYKQEIRAPGASYTMPFGLVQMDNGQVAMLGMRGDLVSGTNYDEKPFITFSSDAGNTWSTFQLLPAGGRPAVVTYLGGGDLFYENGDRWFSGDYGRTWSKQDLRPFNNGQYPMLEGNNGVDRDASGKAVRVMEVGASYPNWPVSASSPRFRYSLDGGLHWQGEVNPPTWTYNVTYNGTTYQRSINEGSVVRASNGWLVAALRTDINPRYYADLANPKAANDGLEGTAVSISKDNGQTWSPLDFLFPAGRMHPNLQLLLDGDLLMTMIVRNDIGSGGGLDSYMRGEDALLSHDNGLTWNLDRRIAVDEFYYSESNPAAPYYGDCGHIATTVLTDGSVLTAYGKYYDNVNGAAVLTKFNPSFLQVPEPSQLLLLASALIGLAARTWRKKS
jgi:hypothetical protein